MQLFNVAFDILLSDFSCRVVRSSYAVVVTHSLTIATRCSCSAVQADRYLPTLSKISRFQILYVIGGNRARIDSARATIPPGEKYPSTEPEVVTNGFHSSFGHASKKHSLEVIKQLGVLQTGVLQECKGCSMAKGRRKPTTKAIKSRADKRGGRDFFMLANRRVCGLWGVSSR